MSIEVLPTKSTRASQVTSEPTGIRSRKSTRSMLAVTARLPAWRIAATAAAWSTIAIRFPPNRSPSTFCMWGMTMVVMVPTEWDMGRESGMLGESSEDGEDGEVRRRGPDGRNLSVLSIISALFVYLIIDWPEIVLPDCRCAQH